MTGKSSYDKESMFFGANVRCNRGKVLENAKNSHKFESEKIQLRLTIHVDSIISTPSPYQYSNIVSSTYKKFFRFI